MSCECKGKFDGTKSNSNGGITINYDASVKSIYVKKNMFGILLHVIVKMENIQQVL